MIQRYSSWRSACLSAMCRFNEAFEHSTLPHSWHENNFFGEHPKIKYRYSTRIQIHPKLKQRLVFGIVCFFFGFMFGFLWFFLSEMIFQTERDSFEIRKLIDFLCSYFLNFHLRKIHSNDATIDRNLVEWCQNKLIAFHRYIKATNCPWVLDDIQEYFRWYLSIVNKNKNKLKCNEKKDCLLL